MLPITILWGLRISISNAAEAGDPLAQKVLATTGRYLGRGLALRLRTCQPGNPAPAETLERTGFPVPFRAFLREPDVADFPSEIAGSFMQPSV